MQIYTDGESEKYKVITCRYTKLQLLTPCILLLNTYILHFY